MQPGKEALKLPAVTLINHAVSYMHSTQNETGDSYISGSNAGA